MPSKLNRYQQKRNFSQTPEPAGRSPRCSAQAPRFVIQKHQASHLHYDFRLEIDGVLKSWAVPKGLSSDSKVKRLAVPTEDHPLEYADFSGRIPAGQYGAGQVAIWDQGTFFDLTPDTVLAADYKKGELKIKLQGRRYSGDYVLVKIKKPAKDKEAWLLFKLAESK